MGLFDDLPLPEDKAYLRRELAKIDESWTVARFDSLPHVVHISTSKDRDAAAQLLKEQSDVVEEVVDEVVQTYHSGFNKAIQNYSQVDLAEAKKHLSARNKQLHQLWYRSVTLRHIISLLDQIEGIAKVPARMLIAEKQFYAAVQLQVQSMLMLEREGLQTVGFQLTHILSYFHLILSRNLLFFINSSPPWFWTSLGILVKRSK
ncbi:Exocyst complex component [Arachis hypogaea]|nr:Exocyst complex component [Arachis hypogaea]